MHSDQRNKNESDPGAVLEGLLEENVRFKAVLFDLDGTLLDTLADLGNATNRVLARQGFPTHDMGAYRFFIGNGLRKLVERALPDHQRGDDNTIKACSEALSKEYGQHWNVETILYPGIEDLLNRLCDNNIRMAVLSNKPDAFTQLCVTEYLSRWPFEQVVGERPPAPRKPDPAGALEIVAKMELAPADFVYLGDTAVDMQTAVSAGMFPVGVLWGFRLREELEANGARVCLEKPLDLLTIA